MMFAFARARDSLNMSEAFTSNQAQPGTCKPAGIGMGKLPVETEAQLVSHRLHIVIERF